MSTESQVIADPMATVIYSTDGEYTLLTANAVTGAVTSAYLSARAMSYLSEGLKRILDRFPSLAVGDGFQGLVQSLISVYQPGIPVFNQRLDMSGAVGSYVLSGLQIPSHVFVTIPHSISGLINPSAINFVPDTAWVIARPEGSVAGNATRIAQTTLEGASYSIPYAIRMRNIVFQVTGRTGAPTARILIYQTPGGRATGPARRIATVESFPIPATGTYTVGFAEGDVLFAPGTIFVLWGRDSAAGSWTGRTRVTQPVDLFTMDLVAGTYPTSFTTAIPATTKPAQIDPATELTGSPLDLTLTFRLLAA